MPTRKQRRRRAKERRHEYEYVYVDDEGQEVEVDEEEAERAEPERRRNGASASVRDRAGRVVEPPSLRKVGRRALLFAPIMFLALSLIASDLTMLQRGVQTVLMLAFFLPFSYLMDRMLYRSYQRRSQGGRAASR